MRPRRLSPVFLALLAAFLLTPSPASAAGAGQVTGTWQFTTPVPSHTASFVFGGTAVGVFGTQAGSCTLQGNGGGDESTATGFGSAVATCYGGTVSGEWISVQCSLSYTRTGTVVLLRGFCSGTVTGSLNATFQFVPTSLDTDEITEPVFPTFVIEGQAAIA
jgi:hypothetical protein